MTGATHPEALLAERLGLVLPEMTVPKANYAKAVRTGDLLFISAHGAHQAGVEPVVGKVGRELTLEQGQAAARITGLNILATIKHYAGDLANVRRFVKFLVFVNADPGWADTPYVANGFSDLIAAIFPPEVAAHARTAVGAAALPFGMPVDIEGVVELA